MSTIAYKFYVYSKSLQWLGEIRNIDSLQWLEEFADVGDVKLVCGKTQNNMQMLSVGNYILNAQRSHILAVIDSVNHTDNNFSGTITVRAKFTSCVWDSRVLLQSNFPTSKNAEQAMLHIVNACKRGLNCNISPATGLEQSADVSYTQGSVLTALKDIASTSNLGFRHSIDANLEETFAVYTGIDRTDISNDAYIGFFALTAGNIKSLSSDESDENYRNYAIVQSGDENEEKREVHVDLSFGGEKRELLEIATDIKKNYTTENGDGTFTNMTYTNSQLDVLLQERGALVLFQNKKTFKVTADLQQSGLLFGKHYDIGDLLPLVLGTPYNICVSARVVSVKIIYEAAVTLNAVLEVSL